MEVGNIVIGVPTNSNFPSSIFNSFENLNRSNKEVGRLSLFNFYPIWRESEIVYTSIYFR